MPPAEITYFPTPNDWALMFNNYTGAGTFLSAINPSGGLLEMTSDTSPSAYWQVFPLDGVYYIRNKAAGASLQLDVILSNQVYMPALRAADISAEGQQWDFISDTASGVTFWNVESAGSGTTVQLDTYSDTLQPFFEAGGHSGQMWSFSSVGEINDVAYSTVGGVATASAANSAVPTAASSAGSGSSAVQPLKASSTASSGTFPISAGATSTSSSTAGDAAQSLSSNSSSHPLSTGAIAGIAVAAAIIGLLAAIGIGAFLWRRKTRPRQNLVPAAEHSHVAEVAGDQQQQRYGTAYKKDAEGSHAVEIGDTAITQQNSLSELPVGE